MAWSLAGAGWTNSTGQTFFTGSTVDMGTFLPFDYQAELRRAFDAWASVGNIEFIQIADGGANIGTGTLPTIRVVGGFIDGQNGSNVLARAFFPSSSAAGGDIVFDSGNTSFFSSAQNFFLTALHEIGHALGLNHEPSGGDVAIMNPFINTSLTGLQTDDIDGIRVVYGTQDFGPNSYFMPASQINLTLIDGAPALTIVGNGSSNVITGLGAAEVFLGADGNDTIRGAGGNDSIDGGTGSDFAAFSGPRSAYTITPLGTTGVRVAGPDGTDNLTNVEWLVFSDQTVAGMDPSAILAKRPSDFGGDSLSDILLQNTNGTVAMLQMAGNQILSNPTVGAPAASWHAAGVADFNGDGRADVFMQHDSGFVSLWQMNGGQIEQNLGVADPGPTWHVTGTGDFNGDGKGDALLRHNSGFVSLWVMDGNQIIGNLGIANPSTQYHVGGTGDFDGDGHSDLLLRHDSGFIALWKFDGDKISSNTAVANPGPQYHIAGTGDFDGDGRTDILMRHDSGFLALWQMNGDQIVSNLAVANPGPSYRVAAIADYNGDGRSDVIMRHDGGFMAFWGMTGAHIDSNLAVTTLGIDWKVVPPSYELL